MLAYVFWHSPRRATPVPDYEQALAAFGEALAAAAPDGFIGCATFALEGAPWLAGAGYEDWYLVDGWGALGTLRDAAVDARRAGTHDALAAAAGSGAGGVYEIRAGGEEDALERGPARWLDKPAGVSYADFREQLTGGGAVWERQLVLGPAPEFCLPGAGAGSAGVAVERRPVYSRV
jgi:hypothetical protein